MAFSVSQVRPLHDWVLLEIIRKDTTPGGIHVPENLELDHEYDGIVVSTGPGMWRDGHFCEVVVKRGDKVRVHPSHKHMLHREFDGKLYCLCSDRSVIYVLDDDEGAN